MKKIVLCLLCMSFLVSCAGVRFDPSQTLSIAPMSAVESNLGLTTVAFGNSYFTNIKNNEGMVNVAIDIATFSKNNELSTLVTEAVAYSPDNWIWQFGPSSVYGSLGNSSVGIQGKNFEMTLFLESGKGNIFSDLFTKETLPKQWLVCQVVRIENFGRDKIILDYREIAPDTALSSASPETLEFKSRALGTLEQMVVLGNTEKIKGQPSKLATRFFGEFVGQLKPDIVILLKL